MHPDPTQEALKTQLLSLGYPWPENLEGKSISWLEAEIRALKAGTEKPEDDRPPQTLGPQPVRLVIGGGGLVGRLDLKQTFGADSGIISGRSIGFDPA